MTSMPDTIATLQEANAIQAERILQLEAALAPRQSFEALGRFTPSEAVILSAILKWEVATYEQLDQALFSQRPDDPPEGNVVKVHACRIRHKLALHGVAIANVSSRGYRMDPAGKARLRSLMEPAP